jgi:hypothetical protein
MAMKKCPLCGKEVPEKLYPLHEAADQLAIRRMQEDFPGWEPNKGVCDPCLERYRKISTEG